ncbi:MAG: bis(5'-nucleosyl)-tetraphosphatase (symmetrical) YqeK, partial [Brevinema sp.]
MQEYQDYLSQDLIFSPYIVLDLQKKLLSEKRYEHVCRVREKAQAIVTRASLSPELTQKIDIAVLMHDFAKGMSSDELLEYAHIHQISLNNIAPPIYHAIVGAWMAHKFFDISDQKILDAITHHTTGHSLFIDNMIGTVLFLADYLEPGRKSDRSYIDQLIPNQLIKAMYQIVKEKMISVIDRDRELSEESIVFYESLRKVLL